MMSKKMKRVAFESSSHHVSFDDARARFKHETLLQEFTELQQETEAQRNTLMALKQKKLTLQAEVRFLRQRYKFLINNKSSTPQEQFFTKPKPTQVRKSKKEKVNMEKQTTLCNLKKKKASQSIQPLDIDLNHGNALQVKEQSVQRAVANQRVRINGPKTTLFLNSGPKVDPLKSQEPVRQKKPVIDLNQIFREEEELHEQCEPFDHQTEGLIRNNIDERLLINRKRKISWQDPVALPVWGL